MKKYIQYITLAFGIMLVSCNQVDFEPVDVTKLMGEKLDSTYRIDSLIQKYDTIAGLFGVSEIISPKELVINGIVTSSDEAGNIYKNIIIQEEFKGGGALKISIDVSGLAAIFPLGQRVSLKLNGLYLGRYAQAVQIGVNYYNAEKGRIEPGRIPLPVALKHIIPYGMPDPAAVVADTMDIRQIKNGGPALFNKLVCIKNAYFTGKGVYNGAPKAIPDTHLIFAPSTDGVGYPQSREIQDGTGSVFVSTSEFSNFAMKPIPLSVYRGNITCLVGFYNDKDKTLQASKIYHQMTLRSLNDLGKGFENYLLSVK